MKTKVNSTDGLLDGRPMGRTAYFSTGSLQTGAVKGQEDIVYPINHYVNCPTSKESLYNVTYRGTLNFYSASCVDETTGNLVQCFPGKGHFSNNLDIYPDKAVYTVNIDDDNSGNTMRVKQTRTT